MLQERIEAFIKRADEVKAAAWEASKFTHSAAPTHEVEYAQKWAKVYRVENGRRASIYAFIALEDFATKQLGVVKAGDIFRPATYKAPAKHKRGSVFQEDFGGCIGPSGIAYLR